MSTEYNPLAENAGRITPANILSSSNTTPIEITTDAAHGFATGDFVNVYDHETNVDANGRWEIIVTSSTEFQLVLSGPGVAGGNTGYVENENISPRYQIPADGDDAAAAAWNVAHEALGDRTAWLAGRVGLMKLHEFRANGTNDSGAVAIWSTGSAILADWTENTDDPFNASLIDVINEDWLEVDFVTGVDTTPAGGDSFRFALFYQLIDVGDTPSFASATKVAGSQVYVNANVLEQINIKGVIFVSGITTGKKLCLFIGAKSLSGAVNYEFIGDHVWTAKTWRFN